MIVGLGRVNRDLLKRARLRDCRRGFFCCRARQGRARPTRGSAAATGGVPGGEHPLVPRVVTELGEHLGAPLRRHGARFGPLLA